MTARVIAITGGKGGVGKSTTTVNLGVSLRLDGYSVALVDADVEMPNLVELLSLEPEYTIHDVLSGTAAPGDAIVEIGDGFAAVPGASSLTSYAAIDPQQLETVISTIAASYEYVLLDTGAGLSYDDILPLGLADEIILVTSPDPAAMENAKRTQAFVRRLNRTIRGVVITKADSSVDRSVADPLDTDLLGIIPDDPAVRRSTAAGQPLELFAPTSDAARGFRELEATLTDGEVPPSRADQTPPEPSTPERAVPARPDPPAQSAGGGREEPVETVDNPPRRGLIDRIVGFFTI